jgi:MSHA biogenesis protein MshL
MNMASAGPIIPDVMRRAALGLVVTIAVLVIAGCASGGGYEPYSGGSDAQLPEAPAQRNDGNALPAMPVAQLEDNGEPGRRIDVLNLADQDIRTVLSALAQSYELDYQIDPSVQGNVTTYLRDVTLGQALDAIVLPAGFDYQIDGRVLRVTQSRMQTRIFTLDYLSMSRFGSGTTTIQRQLGGIGGIGGVNIGGGGGGGGGDIIQTVSVANMWQDIQTSLQGLIFSSGGGTATAKPVPATGNVAGQGGIGAGLGGGGANAPGAFNQVGQDGSRLIVNPISGIIMVSAPPDKLAEVEAFISSIEGSVQRQVLIEAKIVEVSLRESFEFGIDWNFVQRIGSIDLRLGSNAGGGTLTIAPSDGNTERQIGIVLRALERQGEVNVMQSPRVRGMNNQWAVINASTDEVFFTVTQQPIIGPNGGTIGFNTEIQPQQVSVGVTLNVLPQISADNIITMNVRPSITAVIEERTVVLPDGSQSTAPVIDRRESDTVVRVRNGETVVIGGLMTTKQANEGYGVPGLRELPGIGGLFGGSTRSMEKRELVIFITPRIVTGQAVAGF